MVAVWAARARVTGVKRDGSGLGPTAAWLACVCPWAMAVSTGQTCTRSAGLRLDAMQSEGGTAQLALLHR